MKSLLKFSLVVTVVVGGGLAIWLGFLDPEWLRAKAKTAVYQTKDAAAHLAAEATTSTPRLNSTSCAADCRANLRRIEAAKRALQSRGQFATGSFTWGSIERELGARPVCPCGGTYSLGNTQMLPQCSIAGGGTVDTADDHVLKKF
ncbi:MAG: hypothetical protein PWP23_722 [Candidatus Sumerlaeota bacterium]|nr:hypothetical protein [Candidatus Sumerlaeota bacterium]